MIMVLDFILLCALLNFFVHIIRYKYIFYKSFWENMIFGVHTWRIPILIKQVFEVKFICFSNVIRIV